VAGPPPATPLPPPGELARWADGFCAGWDEGVRWARDQMDLALAAAIDPGPAVPPAHRIKTIEEYSAGPAHIIRRLARAMDRGTR
jgi:hypothetical protein